MRRAMAVAAALFTLFVILYVSRMAPSVVPGDPGEYQILATRWGIGHPPGYGFYGLLGNIFTHLVPFGRWAWRVNLLSACCGAAIVALVYAIGRMLNDAESNSLRGQAPAVLGALLVGTGLDVWQHSIHANAHIVTALLITVSLTFLVRWWRTRRDLWLFAFCVVAGLSPVHHPLLVFAFPAYTLFIIAVRPRTLLDWKTLLTMVGAALIGLSAFLYYPIRCALGMPPLPGPNDMHTWTGFIRVITAQGLHGNLFQFTIRDMLYRLWDVRVPLGLHYALPSLGLALVGLGALWKRKTRMALLLTGTWICIVFATINILQDAMAYLLGPVIIVGLWAGVGLDLLLELFDLLSQKNCRLGSSRNDPSVFGETEDAGTISRPGNLVQHKPHPQRQIYQWALVALIFLLPLWSAALNWTRMDLHTFDDADAWLDSVEARFVGKGEGAVLLTEWERMTTVWYYAQVEGRTWDPADLTFLHIPAGTTFTSGVDAHIADAPVYLTSYRPFVAEKYRLMPSQDLWQVLPAWSASLSAEAEPLNAVAGNHIEVVGWQLDRLDAAPGEMLNLDLYMRMPAPEGVEAQQYYLPWVRLGDTTMHFTTDSRFNTPWWQPGEIVVERFEVPVPWSMTLGEQPLSVGVRRVNNGQDLAFENAESLVTLAQVRVTEPAWRPTRAQLDAAVGSLHGDILLEFARVQGRSVQKQDHIVIRPGKSLRVTLSWAPLQPIDENYTVFVQLLDAGLQIKAQHDMTPLGGSSPTLLWFPRWRRGINIVDTHVLKVPADLAPGQYPLIVGMYGFSTQKRVQTVLPDGRLEGDWITLTHIWVE